MPRGSQPGERRGGRKKGVPNKKTTAILAKAMAAGELPHEFLRRVSLGGLIDGHEVTFDERTSAAEKAAPYFASRLATIDHRHTFDLTKLNDDQLAELERVRLLVAVAGGDQDGATPSRGTTPAQDHGTKH